MLNQIQDYQITEERIFRVPDEDIIDYLDREKEREQKKLFRYITGKITYDKEVEDDLRAMLEVYGYRLHIGSRSRIIVQRYRDKTSFYNTLTRYYSVTKYKRPGCHPCGISENDPHMKKCFHWQNCHYGNAGRCQLAQITMN